MLRFERFLVRRTTEFQFWRTLNKKYILLPSESKLSRIAGCISEPLVGLNIRGPAAGRPTKIHPATFRKQAFTDSRMFFWASCRIRTNDPEITNHVLWPTELKRRVGKLTTSRRYNQVPLLRSHPGGFRGSWPCRTYPFSFTFVRERCSRFYESGCKGTKINEKWEMRNEKFAWMGFFLTFFCPLLLFD